MAPQISIIGAGIVGLVVGQCLRRRQIPAIIWEKSKQFPPSSLQNFGITLYPPVYQALVKHLGIDERTFYDDLAIRSDQGKYISGEPIRVNRSTLLQSLSKDLDIRWEHKLKGLATDTPKKHKLTFEHDNVETSHDADLVIVADGVHSATRNALEVASFKLEVLPFVVYNGKRRFDFKTMPDGLSAVLDSATGLSSQHGNNILQITSGYVDRKNGEVAINYTLSRPATGKDDDLLGRKNAEAESLAKRFLNEASALSNLNEPFKTVFNTELMKEDRLLHWLMRIALVDGQEATSLVDRGIVLLGDAAHPQPILGGAGANAAIKDALMIADAISSDSTLGVESYKQLLQQWKLWQDDARQGIEDMHHHNIHASI